MTHSETPPESFPFGMQLRAKREARQLSLEDIANRLRLNPDIVQCLETGDTQTTTPAIFMRGYLRAYAKMLGFADQDIHLALSESGLVVNAGTPTSPRVEGSSGRLSTGTASRRHWVPGLLLLTLASGVLVWWNASPVQWVRDTVSTFHLPAASAKVLPATDAEKTETTTSSESADTPPPAGTEAHLTLPDNLDFMMDPSLMPSTDIATPEEPIETTDPS